MYKPDRVIVRKIKEYDPHLFVQWNNQKGYFEVWREMIHGRRLITPITSSIYREDGAIVHTQLDERILWWLYGADGWRTDRNWTLEHDKRFKEFEIQRQKAFNRNIRDWSFDSYAATHNFYTKRYAPKNKKPTYKGAKPIQNWVAPDVGAKTSPRLFSRSNANAKSFNYRGGG